MGNLLKVFILIGAGYLICRATQQKQTASKGADIKPVAPLPPNAVPTGRTERTYTGGKPGEEVVGFAIRDFIEVIFPNGVTDWIPGQKVATKPVQGK